MDVHAAAPSLFISIKMDAMLTAEQQTHNYIIIRMTNKFITRSAILEKIIGAIIYIIWIFLHDKYINSYAITCQMYQFLSVRGEHSFRYMTDAIFIYINKSFIDINNMASSTIFIDINKWIIDIYNSFIDINKWIIDINKFGWRLRIY